MLIYDIIIFLFYIEMDYHILILIMLFPYLLYSITSTNHLITLNLISPAQLTMPDFMSTWVLNYGVGST